MTILICAGLVLEAVAFFIFGVLFGRKNKKIADSMAAEAKSVATKVEDAIEKKTS